MNSHILFKDADAPNMYRISSNGSATSRPGDCSSTISCEKTSRHQQFEKYSIWSQHAVDKTFSRILRTTGGNNHITNIKHLTFKILCDKSSKAESVPLDIFSAFSQNLFCDNTLQNLRIFYTPPSPISVALPQPLFEIISVISIRLSQVLQLNHVLSALWMKFREKGLNTRNITRKVIIDRVTTSRVNKEAQDANSKNSKSHQSNIEEERLQNYSFLLVQQVVQSLLGFLWDRISTSQHAVEAEIRSNLTDGITGIIRAVQNNFVCLSNSLFLTISGSLVETLHQQNSFAEPLNKTLSPHSVSKSHEYRQLLTYPVINAVDRVLECCRQILQCHTDLVTLKELQRAMSHSIGDILVAGPLTMDFDKLSFQIATLLDIVSIQSKELRISVNDLKESLDNLTTHDITSADAHIFLMFLPLEY